MAAGQARDGLVGDGLEDGGGHVLTGGALVQQRLDIRLGEDAAARRDRVDVRRTLGELVQARRVGLHEGGHLVDEGARATGAGAVHALLDAIVEVDDLRVLATELDGAVGLGDEGLDGVLGGDDLLDELHVQPLGQEHAARPGDGDAHGHVTDDAARLGEDLRGRGRDGGVVALVVGVDEVVVVIDDGELDGGRAHVDAQAQVRVGQIDGVLGPELRLELHELDRLAGADLGGCRFHVVSHRRSPSSSARRARGSGCRTRSSFRTGRRGART